MKNVKKFPTISFFFFLGGGGGGGGGHFPGAGCQNGTQTPCCLRI